MEPLRWGIAGFGWVASDFMAPAILAAGDRLVAVADPSAEAQHAARRRGAAAYVDVAALAADPHVEAIYVATPNHLHRIAVEAAAAAGKAVLCEKPIAATLPDAEAAVAACRAAGVHYATAFDQRHHAAHRALRSAIEAGRVGTVTAVRIVYACWLGPDWRAGRSDDNWRVDGRKAGGGALMDLAPHGLDLVDFLLGEPVETASVLLQRRVQPYAVDDGAMLIGRTRSGVLASLHVAYNCPDALPRRRLEVAGSAGLIVAENTMGQDPGGSLTHVDGATGRSSPIEGWNADESPFVEQVRSFREALRSGVRDAAGGTQDLAALRLLARAYAEGMPS